MPTSICPACGLHSLTQNRRAAIARFVTFFTAKRPHRCHACGWHKWMVVPERAPYASTWTVECEPPDLGAIDATLHASPSVTAGATPAIALPPSVQGNESVQSADIDR